MLTHQQLMELETQLTTMKKENDKNIHQLEGNNKNILDDTSSELSRVDNHPGDLSTELYTVERDYALIDHLEYENWKIDEALKAMKEGTYGICKVCHEEIPFERLQAVPMTVYCIHHADTNPNELRYDEEDYRHSKLIVSKPLFKEEEFFDEFAEDFMDPLLEFVDSFDDSFDSEDNVQDIENFAAADIEGRPYIYNTRQLEQYERQLDDDEIDYMYGTLPDAEYEDNF